MPLQRNHIQTLLLSIAHQDDQKAFEELFEIIYQQLYRFAYHFTKNKEQAEEIVSDVFFNIWQKRKNLYQVNNIHFYLYTAVKNQSINYLNKEYQLRCRIYSAPGSRHPNLKEGDVAINPAGVLVSFISDSPIASSLFFCRWC